MRLTKGHAIIEQLLNSANIQINGYNPWDIKINDKRFYTAVLKNSILGLGESYMHGWWDCEQ